MIFFKLGFTPCKAEQPLQGMVLQGKEAKKDLAICIGLIENRRTFWKHFWNIWNFKLLLGEDDWSLTVAQQTKFHGLVGYKPAAYK